VGRPPAMPRNEKYFLLRKKNPAGGRCEMKRSGNIVPGRWAQVISGQEKISICGKGKRLGPGLAAMVRS